MSRLMYDSTNPFDIPQTARMVAGYTDGLYAWSFDGWKYHGAATKVRICTVSEDVTAHVADVENGALTPTQAAGWASQKWLRGEAPTVYVSASRYQEVVDAFNALHVRIPFFWIAQWDGKNEGWGGAVAKQFAGSATSGGHYDLSWVTDYWPGVDPPPVPAAQPWPTGYLRDRNTGQIWLVTAAGRSYLDGPAWAAALAQGAHYVDVDPSVLAPIPILAPVASPAPPPAPAPVPVPLPNPDAPPIDQVRASYSSLGDFLVHALPDAVKALLRLLGLHRSGG